MTLIMTISITMLPVHRAIMLEITTFIYEAITPCEDLIILIYLFICHYYYRYYHFHISLKYTP